MALRAQTLDALRAWLDHFARRRPSLLLVEDVHWADPTTVDWLGLVAGSGAPGVMVVATSRDSLSTPWADGALDIKLGPLSADEAAQLVSEMVKDDALNPEQRRVVIERGGGIPLFIQELARSARTTASGEALPPRLQELFAVQLRSPEIDLRTAQMAATLGSVFDESVLRELSGGPVFEALADLQAAGSSSRWARSPKLVPLPPCSAQRRRLRDPGSRCPAGDSRPDRQPSSGHGRRRRRSGDRRPALRPGRPHRRERARLYCRCSGGSSGRQPY